MNTTIKYIILLITIGVFSHNLSAQENKDNIVTAKFKVNGVCNMCKDRIENAALIKGVKFAEWNVETDTLKVIYHADKVIIDDIHKSIASVGHSTDKFETNMETYEKLPNCCAYNSEVEKH